MRAIILAAGRGSRMAGMTDDRPKCLVELCGQPLLHWQLESLRAAGVTEFAIVTGYRREMLAGQVQVEFHNPRWAETNMLSSLVCAARWLESEPCIVSYSDIFYHSTAPSSLIASTADLAVSYDVNWRRLWESRFGDPLLDAETFRLDSKGILLEIGNKPLSVAEIEGQYMGLLRFSPAGWREVMRVRSELSEDVVDSMHMTGILQKVIAAGQVPVQGIPFEGLWGEIDSPTDLDFYKIKLNCSTPFGRASATK
jgi:choline kinase